MPNRDRYGREIPPSTAVQLRRTARRLQSMGYAEEPEQPGLFRCHYRTVTFTADLRGEYDTPIWNDTRPRLSWEWQAKLESAVRQRAVLIEGRRLSGIPFRLPLLLDRGYIEDTALLQEVMAQMNGNDEPSG